MEKIEYKSFSASEIDIKSDQGRVYVKGYASIFDNIDSVGDIVRKGAFEKSLQAEGSRVKLCKDHDIKTVIGKPLELKEDSKGLYFDARMGRTKAAQEAVYQLEDEEVGEFSIGYIPTKTAPITLLNGSRGRELLEVKLIEISLVSRAANADAVLVSTSRKSEELQSDIKSMSDQDLAELKTAVNEEYANRVLSNF